MEQMPLMVTKSDGRRVPYDRNKLREGINLACKKRNIPANTIEKIVADVEHHLQEEYVMEVNSRIIGEKVLQQLLALDSVAYIRFASVHYQYADIETFLKELKKLKAKQAETPAV